MADASPSSGPGPTTPAAGLPSNFAAARDGYAAETKPSSEVTQQQQRSVEKLDQVTAKPKAHASEVASAKAAVSFNTNGSQKQNKSAAEPKTKRTESYQSRGDGATYTASAAQQAAKNLDAAAEKQKPEVRANKHPAPSLTPAGGPAEKYAGKILPPREAESQLTPQQARVAEIIAAARANAKQEALTAERSPGMSQSMGQGR